jgi:flavin-dependent dehydrogenase
VSPLIIGGGPAGAAAAIRLALAGNPPTLIERSAGPHHKVCGDFLSADAIAALAALGVDLARFVPACIKRIRLVHGERVASVALPFSAFGLSRQVLDEAVLARAQAAGARVVRGYAVRSLSESSPGWAADAGDHGVLTARAVFLATGKHDLRGAARPRRGDLVGLKTYLALAPDQREALDATIELVLFAGGYVGLQLVEQNRAVLCWVLPAETLRRLGPWPAALGYLTENCPHIARRLAGSRPLLTRPIAVAGIPYGYLHRAIDRPGLFRLGDQAGVIPSLSGDGVAIALYSGMLAASAWLEGQRDAATFHRCLRSDIAGPIRAAGLVHWLCREPGLQPWVLTMCRFWPGLMRILAAKTRLACTT